jgi:hypothetical protein
MKCNIWRVAVRPSYIWDARFLNVKHVSIGAFGNELDRTDISASNKLYDSANYQRLMSSQYSIHHQIALVIHACEKLLPYYQASARGQEPQNGRRLSWSDTGRVVPLERRR